MIIRVWLEIGHYRDIPGVIDWSVAESSKILYLALSKDEKTGKTDRHVVFAHWFYFEEIPPGATEKIG